MRENIGQIVLDDLSGDATRGNVAKLLLEIDGHFYSLEFSHPDELVNAFTFFQRSTAFDEIHEFLSTCGRNEHRKMMPLPGSTEEWIRFLQQNKE